MGLVFDIKRGGIKDGPGIRTSVFLKGCPLRCVWCHNPESQSAEIQRAVATGETCGREMSVEDVMAEVRRDAVFYRTSGGGLTLTGGEPLMQGDFALALAQAAKREGIGVAVDTCGFARWDVLARLLPVTDLFLYDLKCVEPRRHRELTGVENALILENLRRLDAAEARIWIRLPLVPGLNDSEADLLALRQVIEPLGHVERVEVCPYHPIGLEKYARFGLTPPYCEKRLPSDKEIERWKVTLNLTP